MVQSQIKSAVRNIGVNFIQKSFHFCIERWKWIFCLFMRFAYNTFWWTMRAWRGRMSWCSWVMCAARRAPMSLCADSSSSAGEKWRKIMKSGWLLRHNAHTARIVSSSQCSLCETSHVSHSDDDERAREREKSTQARSAEVHFYLLWISCNLFFRRAREGELTITLHACICAAREDPCYTHFSLCAVLLALLYILLYKVRAWRVVYLRQGRQMPSMEANWKENWRAMAWRQIKRSSLFRPLMAPQIESRHASWHLSMLIDERKMNHDDCCATLSESYYYYLFPMAKQNPLHVYTCTYVGTHSPWRMNHDLSWATNIYQFFCF